MLCIKRYCYKHALIWIWLQYREHLYKNTFLNYKSLKFYFIWKINLKYIIGELTHLKRPWFWERLRAGGEGDARGWDGWMASPTQWTWVWVNSGSWWWTGRLGVLQFMGSQRVRHNRLTEQNWTEIIRILI